MGFLTILLMSKLNVWLKILTNKINTVPLHSVNKDFYRTTIMNEKISID